MKSLLTNEQDSYLRKIALGKSTQQCTDTLNARFGTSFTRTQIANYKSNHHISSGKKSWEFVDHKNLQKFPEEVRQFIFENYKGTSHKIMSERIKEKFNYDITPRQIKGFYGNNKLNSGLTGRFEKGSIPKNKGKKQTEFMSLEMIERTKLTRFKDGQRPQNTVPIGTVKELKDGYLWFKIDDKLKPKRKKDNWKPLHHFMYQFYHGPIPDGYDVMFLDGNKRNFDKDNLEIVTKAERLYLNRHGFISSNPAITRSGLTLSRMMTKAYKRKKDHGK